MCAANCPQHFGIRAWEGCITPTSRPAQAPASPVPQLPTPLEAQCMHFYKHDRNALQTIAGAQIRRRRAGSEFILKWREASDSSKGEDRGRQAASRLGLGSKQGK